MIHTPIARVRNPRMAYISPGFSIPRRFMRIAGPYLEKSPNDFVLRKGIEFAFGCEPEMPIGKFARFCSAAHGLQVIGNGQMRLVANEVVAPDDKRQRTPFLAIDIYDAAARCPEKKLTSLARIVGSVLLLNRNLKFQAHPRPLLNKIIRCLSEDSTFLPDAILSYVFAHGKGSCPGTKAFFRNALAEKMLIRTEVDIGGRKIPIYVKGVVSDGALIAYEPASNSLLYMDYINYGKIIFRRNRNAPHDIISRQFSHPELQIAILDAEKKEMGSL